MDWRVGRDKLRKGCFSVDLRSILEDRVARLGNTDQATGRNYVLGIPERTARTIDQNILNNYYIPRWFEIEREQSERD